MLFVNELRFVLIDMCRHKRRLSFWFLCFLLCIVYLVKEGVPKEGIMGPPQALNLFLSSYTFSFPVLPLFLMFLSFGVLPFFDSVRFIRYQKRERVFLSLLSRVFWICLMFTILYLVGGVLLGVFLSGRWDNVWLSPEGAPYFLYGNKLPLDQYYSSNVMMVRYIITSLLLFHMIGLFAVVCYVFIKKYIYSFIIVTSVVILDKMLHTYFEFSLINDPISLEMTSWLIPGLFSEMIYLIGGFGIIFAVVLYICLINQDYFNEYSIDNEKEL
ncbi:hypothetical protein [Bacillus sp. (in: firmicutes)]|uniref:hypothetical protein n=1 Tax=Bacillus sp. TaxID=1409 RepID=UPI0023F0B857|nr:hypothetical protein [Bacillus sp. (in: firmicutes)]